jgi:hypothetical protein
MGIFGLAKLGVGALLVAGGAVLWAVTGTPEAGTALMGAGAVLMPTSGVSTKPL